MTKRPIKLRIIRKFKSLLTGWERNLTPYAPTKNPNHLVDLTPKADLEKSKSYREALKWALENKEVFNIALTGPYGSGKSSILKAFEQTNSQYKYLKISLASFSEDLDQNNSTPDQSQAADSAQDKNGDEDSQADNGNTELTTAKTTQPEKKSERMKEKARQEQHRQIELSILQQIFYRVTDERLPQSRFKRIKKLSLDNLWRLPILGVLWAASSYFVYNRDFRNNFYRWNSMSFSIEAWIYVISFFLSIAGLFWFLFQIAKLLSNAKFSKLNILGGGLELNYSMDKSILNKHLDEILYFFEETDFDVVIIEDLDRFNDPDIFTKLRELNLLINNADQVPRPIKFIYAIKDDIFNDSNRTKFFDFIIPVLPVINFSNALDQFLPKLEAAGLEGQIPKKFLYDITLYINEMRILNNIFNEFMLYKQNLNHVKNLDKLLGMIIYKNIEPKDFSELHSHRGIIHDVMSRKPEFLEHLSKEIAKEINQKNKLIERIALESSSSIKELRAAFIQEFVEMADYEVIAILTTERVSLKNLTKTEYFDNFRNSSPITYYYPRTSSSIAERTDKSMISFKDIEKRVNEINYEDRLKLIEFKTSGEVKRLEKDVKTLHNQLTILRTKNYRYLLTNYKSAINFFEEDFTKNELLVYLVRGGYIDEMYERYMSYFYEKSLKSTDFDFLKHVRNLEPQPFNCALTNIEEILHRLEADDFLVEELLNFDMVDYLFKNEAKFRTHLKALFTQLSNESRRSIDFTYEYLLRPKYAERYLIMLATYWPDLWKHIVDDRRFTSFQLKAILKYLITRCDIRGLDSLDGEHHQLKRSIADSEDLLTQIGEPEFEEKLQQVIEHFRISFTALNKEQVNSPLFDFIYENWHFHLNPDMISLMVKTKGTNYKIQEDDLNHANYTTILDSGAQELIEYTSDYISKYIDITFLQLSKNTKESENTVQLLLKNPNLLPDQYEKIIKKQECKISNINSVDQPLWDIVIDNNKMVPNWDNVITYFNIFSNSNAKLIAYLNDAENYRILSSQLITSATTVNEQTVASIALILILSKDITDQSFAALINAIPFKYDQQSIFEPLQSERIELMIKKNNIPLSVFNFNELKEHHTVAHISLIVKNFTSYFKTYNDYNLDIADQQLLMNSNLSEKNKQKIAELISEEHLQSSQPLAQTTGSRMIKNGHQKRPFTKILVLASYGANQTNLNLVAMHLQDFNPEEGRLLIKALGGKYADITDRKKNPDFPETSVNEQILLTLKDSGIIVDFQPYKGKLKIYHTERKKK